MRMTAHALHTSNYNFVAFFFLVTYLNGMQPIRIGHRYCSEKAAVKL